MTEFYLPEQISTNEQRLRRLYDPDYVHHVARAGTCDPVQVCVDARMLGVEAGTGVATYAEVLARCLPLASAAPSVLSAGGPDDLGPRPRLHRWIAALHQRDRIASDSEESLLQDGRGAAGWAAPDVFREAQVFFNLHGRLLPVVFDRSPEVMHWTYPVPLHVRGARNLYTVHDLIPLTHPSLTAISPIRHRRLLERILAKADGLVTVSETVRQTVIDHFACDPTFVTNSSQAVFAPLQRDPPLPAGLRPGRYFFFCGTVEPRKNLLALLGAYAAASLDLPLVVVGPSGAQGQELEAALDNAPQVVRLGWQPRANLLGLMRRARALLYPSLVEGFGLPIAEAMTLGTPVLTADRGATGEVAGAAALLVDPASIPDMASAIGALAADDALCARLRAAGFERARAFSIGVYGRRLRALYADAMAMPSRAERLL